MSTDEYSQELPDDMYLQCAPSTASYPNLGSSSSCSLPMPGQMDMTTPMAHLPQAQDQEQRQKRKYTRRKQPDERKKRGPRTKDLNAPRMPLNGYVRFLNANRERIKIENPELSFAEVTKKLASEWSSMSFEDKKAYLDEAEKAKEMYMKELHEYQQTESYQEFLNMKQRAKQQQQQQSPSTMSASHSQITAPSQSQSPMSMQNSSMYFAGNQHYFNEQNPQSLGSNQYSPPMYNQQSYSSYGMNENGKFSMTNTGGGGPSGSYTQQQYYPSGHCSDYGNHSEPSQYQTRYNSNSYINSPNGMIAQYNNPSTNNLDHPSMHGNSLPGINSLTGSYDKYNSVMDLPIFTEEFLEHNKQREQELRNYRGLTMQYEEENAILSKHVDDMTDATEKLIQDELNQKETNSSLKAVLERLQHTLVDNFQDVDLPQFYLPQSDSMNPPCEYYRPNMDNIDHFMAGLENFRTHPHMNDTENQTNFKPEPLVQSIHSAISALDEVTF